MEQGAIQALGFLLKKLLGRSPRLGTADRGVVRVEVEGAAEWSFDLATSTPTSAVPDAVLRLTPGDVERLYAGREPVEPVFEGNLDVLDRFFARCAEPIPAYAGRLWRGP